MYRFCNLKGNSLLSRAIVTKGKIFSFSSKSTSSRMVLWTKEEVSHWLLQSTKAPDIAKKSLTKRIDGLVLSVLTVEQIQTILDLDLVESIRISKLRDIAQKIEEAIAQKEEKEMEKKTNTKRVNVCDLSGAHRVVTLYSQVTYTVFLERSGGTFLCADSDFSEPIIDFDDLVEGSTYYLQPSHDMAVEPLDRGMKCSEQFQ